MNKHNWKVFYTTIVGAICSNQIGDEFFGLMKEDDIVFFLTDEEVEELIEIPNKDKRVKKEVQKALKLSDDETQLFTDELAVSYLSAVLPVVCSKDKRHYTDDRLCRVVANAFNMFSKVGWLSLSAPFYAMSNAHILDIIPSSVLPKIEEILDKNYKKLLEHREDICGESVFREDFQKYYPVSLEFVKRYKQHFSDALLENTVFKQNVQIQEIFLKEIIPEKLNTFAKKVSHGRTQFDLNQIVPDSTELASQLLLLKLQ